MHKTVRTRVKLGDSQRELLRVFERLTGQPAPIGTPLPERVTRELLAGVGLGFSQFNEVLLLLGYDRVTRAFFQFIVDGTSEYKPGSSLRSMAVFSSGVDRFRKIGLFAYGNVKYAFKTLARDADRFNLLLSVLTPRNASEFRRRHDPVQPIEVIPAEDCYFLGYVVRGDIQEKLRQNPADLDARAAAEKMGEVVERGKRNHSAYLASDHLDVYVATSMREPHEYLAVNEVASAIFGHQRLKSLKIRWFDPTQAYCSDRVDKGLAEALMLKRAKCTLYLAQESDTLGKDSELASTLAQGKTVVAYVPQFRPSELSRHLALLRRAYPQSSERDLVLRQLRVFEPQAAWEDARVMDWVANPGRIDMRAARQRLASSIARHFDKRAELLKDNHPLGIQVNLESGVANGVLVARTIPQCAELIRRVLTRTMEFTIQEKDVDLSGNRHVYLKESLTGCIFRVMTGDKMLTNTFWNYYLIPSE